MSFWCLETRYGGTFATHISDAMEATHDVWIPDLDHKTFGSRRKGRRASLLHHAALLRVGQ